MLNKYTLDFLVSATTQVDSYKDFKFAVHLFLSISTFRAVPVERLLQSNTLIQEVKEALFHHLSCLILQH